MWAALAVGWLVLLASEGSSGGASGGASLGTPLVIDGCTVRPPAGFRIASELGVEPSARAGVAAGLLSHDGQGPSSMLVAWMDGDASPSPTSRDQLASSVVRHLADELGVRPLLEDARLVDAAVARVELRARAKLHGERRRLLVGVFEGQGRHAVVAFSVPDAAYDVLEPSLRASLDSFQKADVARRGISQTAIGALAGGALGALLVSLALRRKRLGSARGT